MKIGILGAIIVSLNLNLSAQHMSSDPRMTNFINPEEKLLPEVNDSGNGVMFNNSFHRELIFFNPDSSNAGREVLSDLGVMLKLTAKDFAHIYSAPTRINKRTALWTCGLLAAGGVLYSADQEIYDALQRNIDNKYYKPINQIGEFFEPMGYMGFTNKYMFAGLVLGYIARIEPLFNVSFELLESYFITTALGKNAVNIVVGRRGPGRHLGARSFEFNDGTSFPSGHSMNVMQVANILSHHIKYRPFTIVAYGAASSVLLQRITSDHHWPSDVYFGALFGWIASEELLRLNDARNIQLTPTSVAEGQGLGFILKYDF